jgi:outer membrane immunogenic protein
MRKVLFAIAGFAALIGTPVLGADMAVKAPPAPLPSVYDWGGIYIGTGIGVADRNFDWRFNNPNLALFPTLSPFSFNDNLAMASGFGGVQRQWGRFVLGAEASANALSNNWANSANCGGPIIGVTCQARVTNIYTAGGKLGWVASSDWLFYGQGGWAEGHIESKSTFLGLPNDVTPGGWANGWYAGGGIDYVVSKGSLVDVILGIDYRHVALDTINLRSSLDGFSPCPPGISCRDIGTTVDMVQLRLTIKTSALPKY